LEYVSRIDVLLEASLSREALADDEKHCQQCDKGNCAVWRCRDCTIEIPMCRGCIRRNHKQNPFHRIEQWNGHFYRPAELWEVGTYLLVRHHNRQIACDVIKSQETFLEILEERKDVAEQEFLKLAPASTFASANSSSSANKLGNISPANHQFDDDIEMADHDVTADDLGDEKFMRYLQKLRDGDGRPDGELNEGEIDVDAEDDIEEVEIEEPNVNQYLPNDLNAEIPTCEGIGSAQRVIGSYVRVVHTNGIHNIAMISCECRGHDLLPSDLIAARLLPASFERIRTLFSVQLLDYFRLSNLELKATAYQFYHLLKRLTNPMDPATVVNLYREFRRMSRIWRWMKRLKWAGYGNNKKMASEVSAGELSVFCPACPQPGINIPENWKEDGER